MSKYNITIGVCGEVSQGKSSLLNGLIGNLIVPASLTRETMMPEMINIAYDAPHSATNKLAECFGKKKSQNRVLRQESDATSEIYENDIMVPSVFGINCRILDFPGINDAADGNGKFTKMLEEHMGICDILLYVTSADSAFTKASEVELFDGIIKKVNDFKLKGIYKELYIIVNKYDDIDDEELGEVFEGIPKKYDDIPKFKISSHKLLIYYVKRHGLSFKIHDDCVNEMRKIMKNAEISKKARNSIINTKIFDGAKINIDVKDLESGDYDKLIERIRDADKSWDNKAKNCRIMSFEAFIQGGNYPQAFSNYLALIKTPGIYNDKTFNKTVKKIIKKFWNDGNKNNIIALYDKFNLAENQSFNDYFMNYALKRMEKNFYVPLYAMLMSRNYASKYNKIIWRLFRAGIWSSDINISYNDLFSGCGEINVTEKYLGPKSTQSSTRSNLVRYLGQYNSKNETIKFVLSICSARVGDLRAEYVKNKDIIETMREVSFEMANNMARLIYQTPFNSGYAGDSEYVYKYIFEPYAYEGIDWM